MLIQALGTEATTALWATLLIDLLPGIWGTDGVGGKSWDLPPEKTGPEQQRGQQTPQDLLPSCSSASAWLCCPQAALSDISIH